MQKKEPAKYPCQCGKGFATAAQFSDHVHEDHFKEVGWCPVGKAIAKE